MAILNDGVVFLSCDWGKAQIYQKYVAEAMSEFPSIPFLVLDIDSAEYRLFNEKYNFKSHGNGEILWLKDSKIVAKILDLSKEKESLTRHCKNWL